MIKKDAAVLLLPALMFVIIAVADFYTSNRAIRYSNFGQEQENRQKFDTFVAKVKSGEWQLTPERMIEGMRLEREIAELDRGLIADLGGISRNSGWLALLGVGFQLLTVFSVRKRLAKP